MHKHNVLSLKCFSPPVMLATLTIESILTLYTLWRYKLTSASRLVVSMLVVLATFQLAEYHVCTGPGEGAVPWSRLGFVAITTLPPLGLHLMHVLAKKPVQRVVYGAYTVMAGFNAFFILSPMAFVGHECTGNYVIFQLSDAATWAYSVYYYGLLLAGMYLGARWANELKRAKGKNVVARLRSVQGLIIGYLVFLVPTGIANSVQPKTQDGIPSIMCGFAVLLAFILVLYIMPLVGVVKNKSIHKFAR